MISANNVTYRVGKKPYLKTSILNLPKETVTVLSVRTVQENLPF